MENGRCGVREFSGIRGPLPLPFAEIGLGYVFVGRVDGRLARVRVGGELGKGARALRKRHFKVVISDQFWLKLYMLARSAQSPALAGGYS